MAPWNLERIEAAFLRAAVDPSLWAKAMETVATETESIGSVLLPARGEALPNVSFTESIAPSAETYFRDGWHLRDERYNGIPVLMRTGLMDDFDCMSPDLMRRHPYYQEFLAPHGLHWFIGVRVSQGDNLWVISIQRSDQQAPFSPAEKERLLRLTTSLPSSVAVSRLLGASNGWNVLETFELSRTAGVLIDRHGRVIRANRCAEGLLGGDVRIRDRRIVATDTDATVKLDRALHRLIFGSEAAGLANPVALPRVGRRPLLAYPARLPAMIANPLADCQALVVLVDPDRRTLPQAAILRGLFGLTEAEARLAAMLAAGEPLEGCCLRLGIAKETGRNQLKTIFAKTRTSRQVELVLVLTSVMSATDVTSGG